MSGRLAALCFRLAARAFPAPARERFLDEMSAAFAAAYRASAARGRWAAVRYTGRALTDVIRVGLAERLAPAPPRTARQEIRRSKRMGTFWQDVRYGARTLRKNPSFTAVAVLTIGLGLGANAAIFSVLNAVLLQPLPFREPERLVGLWESRLDRGWEQASFTYPNFWDVRDQQKSFEGVAAMSFGSINLTGRGFPERLGLARVSAGFFPLLGVEPHLGRLFAPGEDAPSGGSGNVVLLSHATWRTRFGGDPNVVGKPVTLDGQTYTVIGVLPRGEPWLDNGDVFLPMVRNPQANRGSFEISVIGRLKPGVTREAALADLTGIATRLAELYPQDDKGMGIVVEPSSAWVASDTTRRALWVLMGSVGFLLLIACVNLANLFLAKATGRARERAVRAALGASRGRLVRQTLTESLLVSAGGAAFGLLMAFGIVKGLQAWNPDGIPRLAEVGISGWVLGFTAAITIVTALLSGIVPALLSSQRELAGALREGERNVGGGRFMGKLRGGLVALEVAASLALLIGAGLLLRSFQAVLGQERGFATEGRVLAQVALPDDWNGERVTGLLTNLLGRIGSAPEVVSVAAVSIPPLSGVATGMGFGGGDRPDPASREVPWAGWRVISKDYFKTLGVPLIAGRDFTEQDRIARPWRVIISRRLAEQVWPGQNAVGRTLIMWKGQSNDPAEVIGVAGDMREWELTGDPALAVYFPWYGASSSPINLVIHTRNAEAVQPLLRKHLAELDASLPLGQLRSMSDQVGRAVASRRFTMMLLTAFAGVALVLALAGIYGVLSYAVSRRTSEIGVRLALGASPRKVLRLIVAQGMKPVLLGAVVGVGGAIALTRLMQTLLYGVSATDVATYAGVTVLLAGAAIVSCYWPARGALKVDVVKALRQE